MDMNRALARNGVRGELEVALRGLVSVAPMMDWTDRRESSIETGALTMSLSL